MKAKEKKEKKEKGVLTFRVGGGRRRFCGGTGTAAGDSFLAGEECSGGDGTKPKERTRPDLRLQQWTLLLGPV